MELLGQIFWDPPNTLFTIPYLNHPVRIYGALFALGFMVGYWLISRMFTRYLRGCGEDPKTALWNGKRLADRITWISVIAGVVGARLGHVLFYDFDILVENPIRVFFTWEGGLASHGGAVGLIVGLVAFWLMSKKELYNISFLKWFDLYVIPVALVAVFIRIGNFFNQEIIGHVTDVPWAVIFVNPADGTSPLPRHPVQLYEAIAYLATFFTLKYLYKRKHYEGSIVGLFFVMVFGSRFIIEFWKNSQHGLFDGTYQTGQLLSVPFIFAGLTLMLYSFCKKREVPNLHQTAN